MPNELVIKPYKTNGSVVIPNPNDPLKQGGYDLTWEQKQRELAEQQKNSPGIPVGMTPPIFTYDNSNDPMIAAPYQSPYSTDTPNNDRNNSDINPYLMGLFGIDVLTQYQGNVQDKQNFMKRQQDIFRGSTQYNNSMYGKNENGVYADKGVMAVQPINANVVAEGGETVFNPMDPTSDGVKTIEGPQHEKGGVPLQLEMGDVVYGNLEIPKGNPYEGKTFKQASKLLDPAEDFKALMALRSTPEDKVSARLNIAHKQRLLGTLAQLQQSMNGNKIATATGVNTEVGKDGLVVAEQGVNIPSNSLYLNTRPAYTLQPPTSGYSMNAQVQLHKRLRMLDSLKGVGLKDFDPSLINQLPPEQKVLFEKTLSSSKPEAQKKEELIKVLDSVPNTNITASEQNNQTPLQINKNNMTTPQTNNITKDARTKETMRIIAELNKKAKDDGIVMDNGFRETPLPNTVEEFKTYMDIQDDAIAAKEFAEFKKDPDNYISPNGRVISYEPYKSRGANDRTPIGGADNSSKFTKEQIDELATKIGYKGTKNNKALQQWLLTQPQFKDKIGQLHKQYGMPKAGFEADGYFGVRWDAILQGLQPEPESDGVSATVPDAEDPTVPKQQQPNLTGYEAKIGDPKIPVSGQTPYQMQNLPFNQTLPYLTGFAAALNPYNYATPDYTHWEQSKQEVNVRPQLEQINQMFNRASAQTTGSPSVDASRRASLFGQSLNASNQALGQAQNQNAQMAMNVDQFNINARTTEQNLDVQGWLPVYNEFMASAQDNAATERQAAITALSNTYNKNYQNESMKKLYDDSVLRHMSLQGNMVTKDAQAKANYTIPEWFQEYLNR